MSEEREDVEATLQQDTAPDTSQQKEKWRAIDWIVGATFGLELLLIIGWSIAQVTEWNPDISSEHFAQFYFAWGLGFLSLGYIVLILWPIFKKDDDPRWFHARILSSGMVGGSYAFLLPVVMSLPEGSVNSGGAAALRQAILLATGGLIGLIALGETRRKNDNDREAAESLRVHQQGTLNQQKEQFEKQLEKQQEQFEANAFKDRKAERRERYTKAVEQLGDEKAPIRMGGVYTLVGLVDEWLEEDKLSEDERIKEGQVIINSLCAYIRSPFTLASHYDELSRDTPKSEGTYKDREQEFYAEKAILDSEADVRLGIIKEIHDRLKGPGGKDPGTWSDFEYDFSGSAFFYPINLTKSYYKKPVNFSDSTYKDLADFRGSTYESEADFSSSIYEKDVDFSSVDFRSIHKDTANFSSSTYRGKANFENCNYEGSALFMGSIYCDTTTFIDSTYGTKEKIIDDTKKVDFTNSIYRCYVNFSWSEYNFNTFFSNSIYYNKAYFNYSIYSQGAYFNDSIYNQKIESCATTYNGYTTFYGSIFCSSAHFSTYFDGNDYENMPSKFAKHSPEFFYEYCTSDPDLDELFAKYKATDDLHKDYSFASRALFGTHNNSFDVLQNEAYSIDKNSNNLPIHCDFINSTQKQYSKYAFKEINRIYTILLTAKNLGEIKEIIMMLQSFVKQFHEWREEETLTKIPYDLNKIFGSVPGISED